MDERTGNSKHHRASGFPRLSGQGPDGGEYDALAELFLGDPELGPSPATGGRGLRPEPPRGTPKGEVVSEGGPAAKHIAEVEPATRRVEAVLLGHLPVRASIWVRQYANAVGTTLNRPVGLVRMSSEGCSVELIGPGAERVPLEDAGPADDIEDAVRSVAALADRWIVRVDELDEQSLAESSAIEEVTILTGSDEAAVVASYRLVKSLAATWDRVFGTEGGPELGLAIMGASGEQALAAGEKLERAAGSFLNRPVRVTARVPKVGVSSAATIYRGSDVIDFETVIEAIRSIEPAPLRLTDEAERALDEVEAEPVEAIEPALDDAEEEEIVFEAEAPEDAAEEPVAAIEPGEARADEIETPEPAENAEPESPAVTPEETTMTPPEQPMIVTRHVSDIAPKRIEPAARAATPAPASLIEGLGVLESECPYATGVTLAADELGALHLIADDSDGSDEAVRQLTAAATWASAHGKLLRKAEPALGDSSREPVRHLLTNDSKRVRNLLDTDLRVHLVTEVSLGGQRGRVAVEIN
ncbi:MAG: hypothetical protein RIB60_04995 [Phycisphaerales bacterium]